MATYWWPLAMRSSSALDSVPRNPEHRTVLGVRRQLRFARADNNDHQRVLVAVVALTASDAGWDRDGVARTQRALHLFAVLLHEARHPTLQDEKHFFDVG